MEHIISSVAPGSIAQEMGIEPGDRLLEVNGKSPGGVFDYRYLMRRRDSGSDPQGKWRRVGAGN